jgi:hypothetical protein
MNVNDLAMVSSANADVLIRAELAECQNGDGLDGVALDLVKAMASANGELFTDGECLDMIGRIVDIWRATDLDA